MERLKAMHAYAHCYRYAYTSCVTCDRDTIRFVMFTVWMFTFVAALRGRLYDSIAFLFTGRMPFLPPSQQRQSTEGNRV